VDIFILVVCIVETRMWWSLTNQSEALLVPADQCGTPLYRHVQHANVSLEDPTQRNFPEIEGSNQSHNLNTVTNTAIMTCIGNLTWFPENIETVFLVKKETLTLSSYYNYLFQHQLILRFLCNRYIIHSIHFHVVYQFVAYNCITIYVHIFVVRLNL